MQVAYGAGVWRWFGFSWDRGCTGVSIFFGISGFLICTRLLDEYSTSGRIGFKSFYIRRLHRILPASLVALTVLGALGLGGVIVLPLRQWAGAMCFVANYMPDRSHYIAHFWSLAMEEHFYMCFPLLLALAGSRRALWILVVLAVVVIAWRCVDIHYKLTAGVIALPWFRTDAGCDGLLWGCVAALLMHRPKVAVAMTRWLGGTKFAVLLVIFVAIMFIQPATWDVMNIWSTIKGMLVRYC